MPGEGITVYGNGVSFSNANDIITRHLRLRMGINGDNADAITAAEGNAMIFEHVSVSWGRDETFSVSGVAKNIRGKGAAAPQAMSSWIIERCTVRPDRSS